MSFKLHLIIVTFIIIAVLAAWQWKYAASPASPSPATSHRGISIVRAQWIAHCQNQIREGTADSTILVKLTAACGGKLFCDVPIAQPAGMFSGCAGTGLQVDYRCFSYDRPWTVATSSDKLSIHCDKEPL